MLIQDSADHGRVISDEGVLLVDVFMSACLSVYVCLLSICPSVKLLLLIQNSANHGWVIGDEGVLLVDVSLSVCLSVFVCLSMSVFLLNVIVDSKFHRSWQGRQ